VTGQIVEITKPGYELRKKHGFLEVSGKSGIVGSIALDDIESVIVSVPGCMISTVLYDQLSKRNIPLVISGENFLPTNITFPVEGYGRQFKVMRAQIDMSVPRRKRAWQKIVRSKIRNQATVIQHIGGDWKQLERLSKSVRSGDPVNCEAQAAKIYWKKLFGNTFKRDRKSRGLNSAINYTYTIMRGCVARGSGSAGLHPSFSIHHKNPQNPLNLVDDLIEPFRPIADYYIWTNSEFDFEELTTEHKEVFAKVINLRIRLRYEDEFSEESPLSIAAAKMCKSFANYCETESEDIQLPDVPDPLTIQNI